MGRYLEAGDDCNFGVVRVGASYSLRYFSFFPVKNFPGEPGRHSNTFLLIREDLYFPKG
jgi:hypothetical protein